MSSDTESEARDIRAGYISWCRGELSVVLAGEKFDRFIAKVKADERRSLLEELTTDAEQEASIGRQGNDRERVNAAEKIIEMLNDIRIEGG